MRRGPRRIAGLAAATVLALAAALIVVLDSGILELIVIAAALLATLAATKAVYSIHEPLPGAADPAHPVLFYNPKSGGGKAERFKLADEARARGIEPIELGPPWDLEALVRAAIDRGADALAMAGGDGSQAIVAAIAAEHSLPYACIPAGTRNHFALDLGVNRDDVVGALDAFTGGGEKRVDLAEVNGRVFVNNVSLGLYAEAVQRDGYREAKLRTILDTLPQALGPTVMGSTCTGPGAVAAITLPARRSSFPTTATGSVTQSAPAPARGSTTACSASPSSGSPEAEGSNAAASNGRGASGRHQSSRSGRRAQSRQASTVRHSSCRPRCVSPSAQACFASGSPASTQAPHPPTPCRMACSTRFDRCWRSPLDAAAEETRSVAGILSAAMRRGRYRFSRR